MELAFFSDSETRDLNGPKEAQSFATFPFVRGILITGFAPRVSRDDFLRLSVVFLRLASLGAAVAYAVIVR